jgi:hypothetical protein
MPELPENRLMPARSAAGLAAIVAGVAACGVVQRQPAPAELALTAQAAPAPAPPDASAPAPAPSAVPAAPGAVLAPAFCVPPPIRHAELDEAWQESDRVFLCVTGEPRQGDAGAAHRACASVGPSGDARAEPDRRATTGGAPAPRKPPPVASVGFRATSADGLLSFHLVGGARSPHRAIGTLRDARGKRVLKQAPIAYDEHLSVDGWVGQGLVLHTWVEEGPGCGLWLFDPQKTWPDLVNGGGASLGSCFNGNIVSSPLPGVFVIVDAGGTTITFVEESTLAVTSLQTRCGAGDADTKGRLSAWLDGDAVLVLVYGAPMAGAVVRVDLKRRVVLARWTPPACPAGG